MIEIALLYVSVIVFAGLICKKDVWGWICLYWLLLSIRNLTNI